MSTLVAIDDWRRDLTSAVKRLRVTATSDPGRAAEFADALMQLTAVRLQAWAFAEAAADAPESVVVAARLLAAGGPVGPYASPRDASRYFTATAQLAAVQAGLGRADAAAPTLDGLDVWRSQLGTLPLLDSLVPETVIWTLIARARAALTGADPDAASANALADAAGAHRYLAATTGSQAAAVHLLLADCRWAAGRPEASLAHHQLALDQLHSLVAELPERPRPAVVTTITTMAASVFESYAQRLDAFGHDALALRLRRDWQGLLDALGAAVSPARVRLAAALRHAGRATEAAALGEAGEPLHQHGGPGTAITWPRLDADAALARVDLNPGYQHLAQAEQATAHLLLTTSAEAEVAEQRLKQEAKQQARAAAQAAAEEVERAAAQAAAVEAELQAKERAAAEAAAARQAAEQERAHQEAEARRRELAAEHARQVDPETADAAASALAAARAAVQAASGDAEEADALDRLAEVLRPLAGWEEFRLELAGTLESLVGLRWRLGDAEASREAARELKALPPGR